MYIFRKHVALLIKQQWQEHCYYLKSKQQFSCVTHHYIGCSGRNSATEVEVAMFLTGTLLLQQQFSSIRSCYLQVAGVGLLLLKQQFSCVLYPSGVHVVVGISPRGEISPHYYYVVVGLQQLYCTTCVSEQQERICEYTKNGNEKTQSTQIEHLPLFWYLPVTNCTTRFSERAELAKKGKIKIYKLCYVLFSVGFLVSAVGNIVRVPRRIFMLMYWVQYNFKLLFLVGIFQYDCTRSSRKGCAV